MNKSAESSISSFANINKEHLGLVQLEQLRTLDSRNA
jgi:hypothetical protein